MEVSTNVKSESEIYETLAQDYGEKTGTDRITFALLAILAELRDLKAVVAIR